MLRKIISVLFATIAGAAALIGFSRRGDITIGSNRLRNDGVIPQQPDALPPRQVGQNAPLQVTPSTSGDDSVEAEFSVSTDTAGADTSVASSDAAIADDPTPEALPSVPEQPETTAQADPPAATPTISSPNPPAAPAASAPAQPVRAMW